MKVSNSRSQQFLQNYKKKAQTQSPEAMPKKVEDKVEVQIKKIDHLKVAKNDPNDPTVSTKVLDSLNTGMINFSQKQRDAIATIMSEKSDKVRSKIEPKKLESLKISKNDPNDPTVSTKVLDSLNSGMINFSQDQRDVIASIMSEKSDRVRAENIN
jgi:hypothetical protein